MKQAVPNHLSKLFLLSVAALLSLAVTAQTAAPELVFKNPVLVSGTANQEGAVYRFSNVATGVDAELTLEKFSRTDIVMQDVDLPTAGHNKALQPQFGLSGMVAPYQEWYVDFRLNFYIAGTTTKQNLTQAVFTALDIDGDGNSISEYVRFNNADSIQYAANTALQDSGETVPVFANSVNLKTLYTCQLCAMAGELKNCKDCKGKGYTTSGGSGVQQCATCAGSGFVYKDCGHAYAVMLQAKGPVQNYTNIDTSATQVMVTYTFDNIDQVSFRYGASSGAASSNGSGIRLNSLWAKEFNLAPLLFTLPVNFTGFAVTYSEGDATLAWQARGENLNHFVVQRSTDGKSFTDIATVFAITASSNYTYKDKAIGSSTGVVYYRIMSADQTKETHLSTVKMIRLTNSGLAALTLATFPNPAVSEIRLTLPESWQGKAVSLQLYAADGSVAKSVRLGSAGQTEVVGLSSLPKGFYLAKASCGNEMAQQRIVKN